MRAILTQSFFLAISKLTKLVIFIANLHFLTLTFRYQF